MRVSECDRTLIFLVLESNRERCRLILDLKFEFCFEAVQNTNNCFLLPPNQMILAPLGHLWHSARTVPEVAVAVMARRLAVDAAADTAEPPPTDGDTLPSPSCTRSLADADADSGTAEKVTATEEPAGDEAVE